MTDGLVVDAASVPAVPPGDVGYCGATRYRIQTAGLGGLLDTDVTDDCREMWAGRL